LPKWSSTLRPSVETAAILVDVIRRSFFKVKVQG